MNISLRTKTNPRAWNMDSSWNWKQEFSTGLLQFMLVLITLPLFSISGFVLKTVCVASPATGESTSKKTILQTLRERKKDLRKRKSNKDLPDEALMRLGSTRYRSPANIINDIETTTNGDQIITAGSDGRIRFWNVKTGTILRSFDTKEDEAVESLDLLPEKRKLATRDGSGSLRLWNLKKGTLIRVIRETEGEPLFYPEISLSPGGKKIISQTPEGAIRLWNTQTGDEIRLYKGLKSPITSLAYSTDGSKIAAKNNKGRVCIWEVETGNRIHRFHLSDSRGDLIFTPDGTSILLDNNDTATVELRDVQTGEIKLKYQDVPETIISLTISRNGKYIAAGQHDGYLTVWKRSVKQPVVQMRKPDKRFSEISFLHGTNKIVSTGVNGAIYIWNTKTKTQINSFKSSHRSVHAVAFSPDEQHLATAGDDSHVQIWNLNTGTVSKRLRPDGTMVYMNNDVAYSPDGSILASAANEDIYLWDPDTGKRLKSLTDHQGSIRSLKFSPDGRRLVSTSGKQAFLWDVSSGRRLDRLTRRGSWKRSVGVSPDGRLLATVDHKNETLRFKDIKQGTIEREFPFSESIYSMSFSPDGMQLVFTSYELYLYDIVLGPVFPPNFGHEGKDSQSSVCFTSDGKNIISTSEDGTVFFWNAISGTLMKRFNSHSGQINDVAMSTDDTVVATAIEDGTVLIWPEGPEATIPRSEKPELSLTELWKRLSSRVIGRPRSAALAMAARGTKAIPFLKKKFFDVLQRSRTERKRFATLVKTLGSTDYEDRVLAQKKLTDLVKQNSFISVDLLNTIGKSKNDPEIQLRLKLIDKLIRPNKPLADDLARAHRTINALRFMDTPEAVNVLTDIIDYLEKSERTYPFLLKRAKRARTYRKEMK